MERYYIRTYGCQMNEQDSLQAAQLLKKMGLIQSEAPDEADVILLNTCSVREKPVHKVASDLGRLRLLKRDNPDLILGVMGCVAQQEKEALLKRCRELDLVVGPDHLQQLPDLIAQIRAEKKRRTPVVATRFLQRGDYRFLDLVPERETSGDANKTRRAFVNIAKGCDNMCSFCIVPHVRGREVSRPSAEILREVEALAASGVEDLTLLGQNVNSYGLKSDGELSFTELLYAIQARVKGSRLDRLRFTTSHPKDVGPDLVRAFYEIDILAPHFHLPVQSGSNRILALMRRAYTRESYLHTVSELKRARPDLALTTDFIVGFPGETEEDFQETLALMREVNFDGSFSFLYSPRPYTGASRLPDVVSLEEKKARLDALQDLQKRQSFAANTQWIGKSVEILVERIPETGCMEGRNAYNKVIHFSANTSYKIGERVTVIIDRVTAAALYGVVEETIHGQGLR